MGASALFRAVCMASCLVLAGCGGAVESSDDDPWSLFDLSSDDDAAAETPPELRISQPSSSGYFFTSALEVRIAGTTSDADARIYWSDGAGGQGETSPDWDFCLFDCQYDWAVTVPLAVGYNLITVLAAGDGGTASTAIAITRR